MPGSANSATSQPPGEPAARTEHSPPPPPPLEEGSGASLAGRLKKFLKEYGKLGVIVYLSLSTVSISTFYLALRSGIDVKAILTSIGLPDSPLIDSAGTLAVAYAIHKLFMPVRIALTIALTSYIAKRAPRLVGKAARQPK